jgi:ADP-heptose:LPS heptosyltransferase
MYLAGVKAITSFTYPGVFGKAFEAMAKLVITIPYVPGNYVPQEYLKLLIPFGINSHDTKKYMFVSEEVCKRVKDKMRAHGVDITRPLVVIAPTTGQTYKEWPPERYGAVLKYCAETLGASIALVGGPLDGTVGQKVIEVSGVNALYNGIGDSIEDLLATLSLSSLIVAGDSGTIYIAEAFGASTLVIIGVTDAVEHPLNDMLHRVVLPAKQEFVLRSVVSNYDSVDIKKAMEHLESITVTTVTKELDSLWSTLRANTVQ